MENKVLLSDEKSFEKEMRSAYNDCLIEMSAKDDRIIALDADLAGAMGMSAYDKKFKERHINCGIAEANMFGIAAGLSTEGKIPFAHTFAAFASRRSMDQIFISGAYARQNIKVVGSDPGVAAALNGGTHMAFEDIAVMRSIPRMKIVEFTDETMLRNLMPKIKDDYGMYYIRINRKSKDRLYADGSTFVVGKAAKIREGKDLTIIASGLSVFDALEAADALCEHGVSVRVLDMYTIKPIDEEAVIKAAEDTGAILTVENHNVKNGLGSAVSEVVVKNKCVPVDMIGADESFGVVGKTPYLKKLFGMDARSIEKRALELLKRKSM